MDTFCVLWLETLQWLDHWSWATGRERLWEDWDVYIMHTELASLGKLWWSCGLTSHCSITTAIILRKRLSQHAIELTSMCRHSLDTSGQRSISGHSGQCALLYCNHQQTSWTKLGIL